MTLASASTDWLKPEAEARLFRALLRAARAAAVLQDQIDCAELALAGGFRDVAATLYGMVFLQRGFSPEALAQLQAVDQRTGLWGDLPDLAVEAPRPQGFSVDLAVVELRRLMSLKPALGSLPHDLDAFLPPDLPTPVQPDPEEARQLVQLSGRVAEALRSIPHVASRGGLAAMLRGLADEVLAIPPVRVEEHLDLGVVPLAALFALEQLQKFLLATQDLLVAETAAGSLFEESARLDPAVLGPYFSNVRLLIRNARDIFALIDAAAGGRAVKADVECWCALLSAHLSRLQILDLLDELGDRGMTGALRSILVRIARSSASEYPFDLAWRIRDVCLDIDELAMAAQAQNLIALWRRIDANEWKILGDIRASLGDHAGAEMAFQRALLLYPAHEDAGLQLAALRAGIRLRIEGGYMTSPGRRRLRLARLEAFRKAS